jgi:hypothetical protein
VKGSASTTAKCGELGDAVTVAAALCDEDDDCMGFTATEGAPDCLVIAGTVVEGYKDSSKDTYLKRMGLAEFTYMFDPPSYEPDSCSEECGGGVLNRLMACKTTANTTVPAGMCSHLAWMNKDALPDESIPCNTFECGPPPQIKFVMVQTEQCVDKAAAPLVGDRTASCGSGLDRYLMGIVQNYYTPFPETTQWVMESANGPCFGTYRGETCEFVPGCYYNLYIGSETGLVYGEQRLVRFYTMSRDGGSNFWVRAGETRCMYVEGPGESKVDFKDQNVGGEFYEDGTGWKMSFDATYSPGYDYRDYYYYHVYSGMIQTNHSTSTSNLTLATVTTGSPKPRVTEAYTNAFKAFKASKLEQNGKDLSAVMKEMRDRTAALLAGRKAAVEAYKKRKAAKTAKKSKACAPGKAEPKGKALHLKPK